MKQWLIAFSAMLFSAFILFGCSGGGQPVSPGVNPEITPVQPHTAQGIGAAQLWGVYEVYINPEKMVANAVLSRSAMFTANCTNLLNPMPGGGVGISFNSVENLPDYIDFDLVVTLTHPYPGLPQFHGYDVRGVFMGDGSEMLTYNSDLVYPVIGVDQSFQPITNPDGSDGHPDGYTRWFNFTEFSGDGMPLFSYTPGNNSSPDFAGTATLCPYKYFADSLGENESLTDWLYNHPDKYGVFSSGAVNSRNYKIRLPKSKPLHFGYAIIANWAGKEPEYHPANAPEAIGCDAHVGGTPYYVDSTHCGGDIAVNLEIFDWGSPSFSGAMDEYQIFIESTALASPYEFSSLDMTPIGSGVNYSIYFAEFPADGLTSVMGNEFWVIVETVDFDYSNEFGVMNDAWDDPLAAFFRYDLEVSNQIPTQEPVCDIQIDPCTLHYWDITDHVAVTFDASGSYDPDGDEITFHWDFDGDDIFDEPGDDDYLGDPINPSHIYYEDGICSLKVEDENGAFSICTVDVDITVHQSKNIPLRPDPWVARDLAVDPANGDLHILYYWHNVAGDTHWTETMKYSPCDCYMEPPEPFHVANQGAKYFRIEVSLTHHSVMGGDHTGCSGKVRIINPDGIDDGPNWAAIHTEDLWAFNNDGLWPLDICTLYGWYNPPWNLDGHNTYVYRSSYPAGFPTFYQTAHVYWGTETWTGYDKLFGNYVRGIESVASGNSFWALKESDDPAYPDSWGTRWRIEEPATYTGVEYDGAWFGTGIPSDDDDSWNDANDLTRDVDDNLLVLDKLSDGTGRIKAFIGDDSGGAPVAAMDVPDEINDTPVRIDSNDYIDPIYGNLLYILHGDSTDWYYLSIYFPEETPW